MSSQEYGPWGKVLTPSGTPVPASAPIVQTTRNFTGQKLDGTGLLNYNARMYDPVLGRFVSPDDTIPGSKPLSLHPSTQKTDGKDSVPSNAQYLARYTYVLNNPLGLVDNTGHDPTTPTTYDAMASLTYSHLMYTIRNDSTVSHLADLNATAAITQTFNPVVSDEAKGLAYALFTSKIGFDGADWDMKQYLRKTLTGTDYHGTEDNLYAHIPGTAANEHSNFNVFGNVYFGFIGRAAGFSSDELFNAAGAADAVQYQLNEQDQFAVTLGIWLYDHYGLDMTEEQFADAIAKFASQDAHTCNENKRCD